MKALISASNELPAKDQGLEALWDRFLVRLYVDGISEKDNFNKMISEKLNAYEDTADPKNKITAEEYKAWDSEIDGINVPENVFNVIHAIRVFIAEHNKKDEKKENQIYISDRRWRKIVRLLRASAFLNGRIDVDLMDCFLIKHCIWNVKEQRNAVSGFVKDAIEKHGYSVSFDFKAIQEELKKFQAEIDEDTKFVKDTTQKVLEPAHNDYYEILNPPDNKSILIKINDFNNLSNTNAEIRLSYWYSSWSEVRVNDDYYSKYQIRKGNSNFTIFINDKEYTIKHTTKGGKRQQTRKPNEYTEKAWDDRVKKLLQHTTDMKLQIEAYRTKDLEHLRINLFVESALASVVESHITATIKEIEKIEVSIRGIQNGYKNLKEEEIVIKKPNKKEDEEEDEQEYPQQLGRTMIFKKRL
jgi:MoxR-like ATPase